MGPQDMSFFVRKFGQGISREGIDAPGILSLLETEESQRMTFLANSDPDHDSHDREDHEDGRTRGGDGDDATQFQHSHQPTALIRVQLARSMIQSLIRMRSSKWFALLSLQLRILSTQPLNPEKATGPRIKPEAEAQQSLEEAKGRRAGGILVTLLWEHWSVSRNAAASPTASSGMLAATQSSATKGATQLIGLFVSTYRQGPSWNGSS